MKVHLVVVKGRPEGMEIPVPLPQFLIGRDPRCHLRPSSESVSKLHCAVVQRKDGVFVRDLQSTNGTFVNNDRINEEVPVKDGDLVKVGPLVLAIKIFATEPSPAAPKGDEDDQAVSWLLDFSAGGSAPESTELGSKTTIMDMSGGRKTSAEPPPKSEAAANPDEQPQEKSKGKQPRSAEKPKARSATADVASDLLEKLLAPPRKKKS